MENFPFSTVWLRALDSRIVLWWRTVLLLIPLFFTTQTLDSANAHQSLEERPTNKLQSSQADFTIAFHSENSIFVMEEGRYRQIRRMTFNGYDNRSPSYCDETNLIAFSSKQELDTHQIFYVKDFGIEMIGFDGDRVTTDETIDYFSPEWSPDCQSIVMEANDGTYSQLYVLDFETGDGQYLTEEDRNHYKPSWSPDGSQVAFYSDFTGNAEIYTLDIGTGTVTQITDNPDEDVDPIWSPDGTQVAFISDRDGSFSIYSTNLVDGSVSKILDFPEKISPLMWDSEQSSLVFSSSQEAGTRILAADLNGSNIRALYQDVLSPGVGNLVLFHSDEDGDMDLYVMDVHTKQKTNLTNDSSASDWWGRWSPDGSRIVFYSDRDGDNEIYVMDADGSNLVKVTDNEHSDLDPGWSPDGQSLVYISSENDTYRLMIVDIAQLDNPVSRYEVTWGIFQPDWSPDGNHIAYQALLPDENNWDIFIIPVEDGEPVRLTTEAAVDVDPQWSPDSQFISFSSNRGDNDNRGIYLLNPENGNVRLVLTSDESVDLASWSNDGAFIVISTRSEDFQSLRIANLEGDYLDTIVGDTFTYQAGMLQP